MIQPPHELSQHQSALMLKAQGYTVIRRKTPLSVAVVLNLNCQ